MRLLMAIVLVVQDLEILLRLEIRGISSLQAKFYGVVQYLAFILVFPSINCHIHTQYPLLIRSKILNLLLQNCNQTTYASKNKK